MKTFFLLLAAPLLANTFTFSAEYLCLWMKRSPEPAPLVAIFNAGPSYFLSELPPESTLLLGEKPLSTNIHSGGRFSLGAPITKRFGMQASYLFLPQRQISQSVSSDGIAGSPFLLIPYFDVTTNAETSTDLSLPGMYAGYATLALNNALQSAEGLFYLTAKSCRFLTGFKWCHFKEHLTFNTTSPYTDGSSLIFSTENSFKTQNNFYGALLGLSYRLGQNRVHLETAAKLSLGALRSNLTIDGKYMTNLFSDTLQTYPGGYFALPTNIGSFHRTSFAVLPEISCNLLLDLKKWASFQLGYTFLYLNKILWAGNTIDPDINPTQALSITQTPPATLVGEAAPTPRFHFESFYIQGLTAGFLFTY